MHSNFSNRNDCTVALQELAHKGVIYKLDEFYALHNDHVLVSNRRKNDFRAKEYEHQAYKKSALIAKFPYVKGVFISGSLSKGTMSDDGDIDYFIVTQPNRLWIARTLLILYKKVFLLNSRKYFCINYLVDEQTLEIEQKNRFTATELITLLPMVNASLYTEMMAKNTWVKDYYTQIPAKFLEEKNVSRSLFQKIAEPILNTKLGDAIDDFFMNLTLKRWKSKFHEMNAEDFKIALRTTKRISKHHPSHFQKKVLQGYQQRLNRVELVLQKANSNSLKQA